MSDSPNKIGFQAERLKRLREARNLSQRELARQCGFSETLIRKYEAGESDPAGYFIRVIASKLEVSADYLLGLTNAPRGFVGDGTFSVDEATVVEALRRDGWSGVIRLAADRLAK
jgi:transcriptional regulator with XRE-family HTH domain